MVSFFSLLFAGGLSPGSPWGLAAPASLAFSVRCRGCWLAFSSFVRGGCNAPDFMPCTFGLSPTWFWPVRLSSSSSGVGGMFRPPSRGLVLSVGFQWPGGSLGLGGWGLCFVFTLIRHPCLFLQCWMNFPLFPKVILHHLQALLVLSFISLLCTSFRFFASAFLCSSCPTSSGLWALC